MAEKYSFGIGLWKTIKNVAIVVGIPALALLADNWVQIIPAEWNTTVVTAIIGGLAYLVKNWIENRTK